MVSVLPRLSQSGRALLWLPGSGMFARCLTEVHQLLSFITENARHFRSNPTQTWPGSWQTRDTRWQRTSFPYRISCYVCALLILTDWCSTKTHSDPAITQPVLGSCGAKILHPTGLHTALTTRAHGFESRLGKRCRGERIGIATCRFLNRRLALLNSTPVTKQCR